MDGRVAEATSRPQREERPSYATGSDGKVDPRAIFQALRDKAKPDYIAIADGGDLLQLRPRRPRSARLYGCRRVRLPRRRNALRCRSLARLSRPTSGVRHRRRRLWHQRHGDRYRGASRREDGRHRIQQRRMEYRASPTRRRTMAGAWWARCWLIRTTRRWRAPSGSWRARREAGGLSRRYRAGARERSGSGRCGDVADGGVLRRDQGTGLRPRVPAA